jgi:hypothetical protein
MRQEATAQSKHSRSHRSECNPRDVYFDHRFRLLVHALFQRGRTAPGTNLCAVNMTLSELHRLIEERNAAERGSLQYLCDGCHKSQP